MRLLKFEQLDAKLLNVKRTIGGIILDLGLITTPIDLTIKGVEGWESVAESVKIIDAFIKGRKGEEATGIQDVANIAQEGLVAVLTGPFYPLAKTAWALATKDGVQEGIGKGIAAGIKAHAGPGISGGGFGGGVILGAGGLLSGGASGRAPGAREVNAALSFTKAVVAAGAAMAGVSQSLKKDSYELFVSQSRARKEFQRSERQILEDNQRAIQNVIRDFHEAERQAEQAYYQQRTEAVANYSLTVQRAEENHQQNMARLRQRYDIQQEDNIRSRDAIAYLRERRNYNVERQNAETDYANCRQANGPKTSPCNYARWRLLTSSNRGNGRQNYRRQLADMRTAQARERSLRLEAFKPTNSGMSIITSLSRNVLLLDITIGRERLGIRSWPGSSIASTRPAGRPG